MSFFSDDLRQQIMAAMLNGSLPQSTIDRLQQGGFGQPQGGGGLFGVPMAGGQPQMGAPPPMTPQPMQPMQQQPMQQQQQPTQMHGPLAPFMRFR